MGTTVGANQRFQSSMDRGSLRIWLRLFLGISGAAVAIAVALGLLVVLAASASQAQARPLPSDLRWQAVSATAAAPSAMNTRSAAKVPSEANALDAAAQLAAGSCLLALGFGFLLSRRGSRLLAGGSAAEAG